MAGSTSIKFEMSASRVAVENGLRHVEQQVFALESAVSSNPSYAFDLAKALVESACKTILTERSVPFNAKEDLPGLFRLTHQSLPLLPGTGAATAARDSLVKTVSGLHTALQGVCELRSQFGFTSHGYSPIRSNLEMTQALLAAQAADAIVGFLYRVHCEDRGRLIGARLEYAQHPDLNIALDETNSPVQIIPLSEDTLTFAASEILFYVDESAYRAALASFEDGRKLELARTELVELVALIAEEASKP